MEFSSCRRHIASQYCRIFIAKKVPILEQFLQLKRRTRWLPHPDTYWASRIRLKNKVYYQNNLRYKIHHANEICKFPFYTFSQKHCNIQLSHNIDLNLVGSDAHCYTIRCLTQVLVLTMWHLGITDRKKSRRDLAVEEIYCQDCWFAFCYTFCVKGSSLLSLFWKEDFTEKFYSTLWTIVSVLLDAAL